MTSSNSQAASVSLELRAGDVLDGKYLLVGPLASGGMGCVWTARNLATGVDVAVKVLNATHASQPGSLERFRREARATSSLSHRAIVQVFDLIELDPERGPLVMIMELLRGRTLARQLETMGALSIPETLEIVLPLLSALSYAHGLGIVHRDLKPANVFLALEPDGHQLPKIVDFGISKLLREAAITLDGQIVGTFSYMSPEQALGEDVDARSDVFSLGILLYECLSGENPFAHRLRDARMHEVMSVFELEPTPLEVPTALWRIVRRALAKHPDDRFASAADLAEALKKLPPMPRTEPRASLRGSVLPPPIALGSSRTGTPRATLLPTFSASRQIAAAAILASVGAFAVMTTSTSARSQGHRGSSATAHACVHAEKYADEKHLVDARDVLRHAAL